MAPTFPPAPPAAYHMNLQALLWQLHSQRLSASPCQHAVVSTSTVDDDDVWPVEEPVAALCGRCCIKQNNLCFLSHVCIVAHIAGDDLSDVEGMESVQPEEEHHVNFEHDASDFDVDALSVKSSSDDDDEGIAESESSEASDVESVSGSSDA